MEKINFIKTFNKINRDGQIRILNEIKKYENKHKEMADLLIGRYVSDVFREFNGGEKEWAEVMAVHSFEEDVKKLVPKVLKGVLMDLYPDKVVLK